MNSNSVLNRKSIFLEYLSAAMFEVMTNEDLDLDLLIDDWGGQYPSGFRPWEETDEFHY